MASRRDSASERLKKSIEAGKSILPPSLNGIRGGGHFQMEEAETLRRLQKAIHDLPLKEGQERHCAASARAIFDQHQTVAVELRLRKKSGTASAAKVERDLKQIASRSTTLFRLLKKADRKTFEMWAAAGCDDGIEQAKQEWLQLKRLLEASAERASSAAKAAKPVKDNLPANGKKKRRPQNDLARNIVVIAANVYEQLTGDFAFREVGRQSHKPCSGFHRFLGRVFQALGIDSSPDTFNRWLQEELRKLRQQSAEKR
jgi:hypothetical protein